MEITESMIRAAEAEFTSQTDALARGEILGIDISAILKAGIEAPKSAEFNWADIPDEFNWLAMDQDGMWYVYPNRPYVVGLCWLGKGYDLYDDYTPRPPKVDDWENSKMKRPKP